MQSTWQAHNAFMVRRFELIGGSREYVEVWEREPQGNVNRIGFEHSAITTIDVDGQSVWYGKVGTRRLTPELEAMRPMSPERYEAVTAWHDGQTAEALAIARAAFPEDAERIQPTGQLSGEMFVSPACEFCGAVMQPGDRRDECGHIEGQGGAAAYAGETPLGVEMESGCYD